MLASVLYCLVAVQKTEHETVCVWAHVSFLLSQI